LRLAGTDVTNTIYQATGALGISTGSASGITFYTNLANRYQIDATGVAVWSVGGSESMRLNATGLGLGTASPAQRLHINTATTYQGILINGNQAPSVCFATSTNTTPAWKVGLSGNNSANFAISSGAAATDAVTINSSGNLGIGTASWPSGQRLRVAGGDVGFEGQYLYLTNADANIQLGAAQNVQIINSDSGNLLTISRTGASSAMAFSTAGSERIRITPTGLVGIGTASPSFNFQVSGTQSVGFSVNSTYGGPSILSSGSNNLFIQPNSQYTTFGGNGVSFAATVSVRAISGAAGFSVEDSTASNSWLFVNSSGNVGIGTASPSVKLEVNGQIRTAAPTGGTAANWRLGTVHTVSPTSPNRTIEVDIGGTIYYLHAKTTNN
jgi:hypothetical protein